MDTAVFFKVLVSRILRMEDITEFRNFLCLILSDSSISSSVFEKPYHISWYFIERPDTSLLASFCFRRTKTSHNQESRSKQNANSVAPNIHTPCPSQSIQSWRFLSFPLKNLPTRDPTDTTIDSPFILIHLFETTCKVAESLIAPQTWDRKRGIVTDGLFWMKFCNPSA